MESMSELSKLVKQGFTDWERYGNVNATYRDGLVLFNYSPQAQFENRWNWFERVSRGLILNAQTGDVVARPFDKFFNWLERGHKTIACLLEVTEKLDGSLGIGYFHNGSWKVATRGSFTSEQALWATEQLPQHDFGDFPVGYTPLWEIVYPNNRIVVDYGDMQELVLLAVRHIESGAYLPYSELEEISVIYGFLLPKIHQLNINDCLSLAQSIDASKEGWVLFFADGQRFKIKGDRYKEVHRLVTNTSFRRVLEAIAAGSFDEMIAGVPDEFLEQIHGWHDEIEAKVSDVVKRVELAFGDAPKDSRKEFALWVNENYSELSPYLFRKLDNKEFKSVILRKEF
jgi:RNA ligase